MRELEEFARLGTELDRATRRQLERGYRVAELLKQPMGRPLPLADQILVLYAGVAGHLDHVPVARVREFEEGLIAHAHAAHPEALRLLDSRRLFYENLRGTLDPVITDFQGRFASTPP
jgi:F-type H+-transporting ATPase subunit alpha